MIKKLLCKTCQYSGADSEPIALFDPETISMPLYASMLIPITDESPFPPRDADLPDLDWYYLRCPSCGSSPFGVPEASEDELQGLSELEILTTDGLYVIGNAEYQAKRAILFQKHSMDTLKIADPLKCTVCGKVCKSQLGLQSHMRSHQGKKNDR